MSEIHQFFRIADLFERYTVFVEPISRRTAVYCDECDRWVAEYPGDTLSTKGEIGLYEEIVDDHGRHFAERVEIGRRGITESFK